VQHRRIGALSLRSIIVLGFAATLGIWVIAGYDFSTRVANTRADSAALLARYMNAQAALSTVRANVHLGSGAVRDALIDPNPTKADYRGRADEAYAIANQALTDYVPVWDSVEEREPLGRLRHALDEFRQTKLQLLATDSSLGRAEIIELLRTHLIPRRDAVLRVSEEAQDANLAAFVRSRSDITSGYDANERRFWWSVSLALAGSLAIALLAVLYSGRLERRLERQRLDQELSARELQQLSSRLITVQEEERRRIARELHDEVGQGLMAIRVELAVAQNTIAAAGVDAHILEDVRSITEGALSTIRDLSHRLHPSLLDDLGLVEAIEWYLREFGRRYHIRMEVAKVNMADRLAAEIETSVYRIVQEALTNVAKHARATTCRLTLQRLANTVLVTLEDNGVGFDPQSGDRNDRSLGLIGIRERATQLRGTVRIESTPGKGTRLTVELPARLREPVAVASTSDSGLPVENHMAAHG
jgi:signal transduction histidine kinase